MSDNEYTDPNNKWLNNAPTKGDKAGGQGFPSGTGIDVKPDGVKLFSTQATGEAEDFVQSAANGVLPLQEQIGKIGASFQEAEYFMQQHSQGFERLAMFNKDAMQGMMALGVGARTIAIDYVNADTTTAAKMSDVEQAFDVAGGKGFVNGASTGGENNNPRGQDNPVKLPEAQRPSPQDYGPTDPNTVKLGTRDIYQIPEQARDDLQNLNPADIRDTHKKEITTG